MVNLIDPRGRGVRPFLNRTRNLDQRAPRVEPQQPPLTLPNRALLCVKHDVTIQPNRRYAFDAFVLTRKPRPTARFFQWATLVAIGLTSGHSGAQDSA